MISKGNQVKFARFVLLAVSEKQKHTSIFFCSMYNKTNIRFGFRIVISRIIKVSVRLSAEAAYLYLDYSGYHKNLIQ